MIVASGRSAAASTPSLCAIDSFAISAARLCSRVAPAGSTTYSRDFTSAPRLIQHKNEAFWFYRFLSIVYDKVGGPRRARATRTATPIDASTSTRHL